MKFKNKLFIIPMCIALLSGCSNIELKYYKTDKEAIDNTQEGSPETPNINIEDFINKTGTTYTDNITSTSLQTLYETCKKATVTIEIYVTKKPLEYQLRLAYNEIFSLSSLLKQVFSLAILERNISNFFRVFHIPVVA